MKSLPVTSSNERVRIGARLRDARQRQGLTIEQVATSTSLTKGFISRVERDMTSPSVSTLVTLCEVLSLPVGALFEAADTAVVRGADAPEVHLTGSGAMERLVTPRAQGRLQLIRSTIAPRGSGGEELYTLNCEVEVAHVLSGRLELSFGYGTEVLWRGDTITFSGREPHSWCNPDPRRSTEVLWVVSPAPWATTA